MTCRAAWNTWPLLVAALLWPQSSSAQAQVNEVAPEPVGAPSTETAQSPDDTDPAAARKAEADALRLRALSYYDAGDYVAARREFERANQLLPSFRLLYNLGIISLALTDAASAYGYFERC